MPQALFAFSLNVPASLVAAVSFQSVHSLGSVIPMRWLSEGENKIIYYFLPISGKFFAIAVHVVAIGKYA